MVLGNQDMANFPFLKTDATFSAKQVVQILRPAFSPVGSNHRVQEEVVMTKFVKFLGLCEGNMKLAHIIVLLQINMLILTFT